MWTPEGTTRLIRSSSAFFITLQDNSTIRVENEFIAHFSRNLNSNRLRSFTVDTVPISLTSITDLKTKIPLQLVLAKSFQMIQHVAVVISSENEVKSDRANVYEMSSCNDVIDQTVVDGLANLTAFKNGSIKALFLDRTIVRMQN